MRAPLRPFALALLCGLLACTSQQEQRDEHVREAEVLAAEGRTREALLELRNALKLDPTSADLNLRIARIAESQGLLADALFFYGEALRLEPTLDEAALSRAALLTFEDRDEARALVAGVLGRDPKHVRAHVARSRLELVDERFEEALAAAREALEVAPGDVEALQQLGKVHHVRARAARRDGQGVAEEDFAAAAEAFGKAVAESGETNRWINQGDLAKLLAEWPGHGDEAEKVFREAMVAAESAETPGAVGDVAQLALLFGRQTGRRGLVRHSLETMVVAEPGNHRAWMSLARLAEEEGAGGAEVVLRDMLEARPGDPEAHRVWAHQLAAAGRLDEALAHLEGRIEAGVAPVQLLGELANLLYGYQRVEQAREVVARLEREYPAHPRTALARAHAALHEGEVARAAEILRELTDRQPSVGAFQLLSEAERRRGNVPAALEALDQAFELAEGGTFPEGLLRARVVLLNLSGDWRGVLRTLAQLSQVGAELGDEHEIVKARALYEIGREKAGRRVLEKVLEKPFYPVAAVLEYVRREAPGDREAALKVLDGALELRPKDALLLTARARMDRLDDRPEDALARIQASEVVTPGLLLERALALRDLGQAEAAERSAMQAFDADPSLLAAAQLVVSLYRAQGREAEAIVSFEEALAAGGLRAPARFLLAQLHTRAGDRARARELLEGLVEEVPAAKNDLAYLLAQDGGDPERAVALAQEARQRFPEAHAAAHTLGYAYFRKGLYGPAVDQLRTALSLSEEETPARSLYLFHLGQALESMGNREDAATAYRQALSLDADFDEARRAFEALGGDAAATDPS